VLREVEAKRAILAEHQLSGSSDIRAERQGQWGRPEPALALGCRVCDYDDGWLGGSDGCPTLRHLAAVYADHPDYRDEWRP
jgi:hypothetical protein